MFQLLSYSITKSGKRDKKEKATNFKTCSHYIFVFKHKMSQRDKNFYFYKEH